MPNNSPGPQTKFVINFNSEAIYEKDFLVRESGA
jgi:hypothetical protein